MRKEAGQKESVDEERRDETSDLCAWREPGRARNSAANLCITDNHSTQALVCIENHGCLTSSSERARLLTSRWMQRAIKSRHCGERAAGMSGNDVPDAISVMAANLFVKFCQGCLAVAISRTVMPSDQMSALRPYASCLITCPEIVSCVWEGLPPAPLQCLTP